LRKKEVDNMNYKVIILVGALGILLSIISIAGSFFLESVLLMIFSIIILVVSIVSMFIFLSIDMFSKDKQLNIEALREQGLTIVECSNCYKKNVLEDQYCIFCGEKLNNEQTEKV
jgi:hypothetical protein